jgi:hypothetical protein
MVSQPINIRMLCVRGVVVAPAAMMAEKLEAPVHRVVEKSDKGPFESNGE